MFCVKDYNKYCTYCYFCRTIEKAKEIFEQVFWKWIIDHRDWHETPQDYDCETWEKLLQRCWENGGWDDVVSCEPIICEEDKS